MKCDNIIEMLPLFLLSELNQEQNKKIEEHLRTCASCQQEAEALQVIFSNLEDDQRQQLSPLQKIELENKLLKQTIQQRLDHTNESKSSSLKKVILLAASIAIFIFGFSSHQLYLGFAVDPGQQKIQEYNYPENFQPTFSQKTSPKGLLVLAKGRKALRSDLK